MLSINGEYWDIILVEPTDPLLLMPDNRFAFGVCDDTIHTIAIRKDLYGDDFEQVLCHELVHAAMFAYNIKLSYHCEEMLAEIISIFGEEIINTTDMIFDRFKRGRY